MDWTRPRPAGLLRLRAGTRKGSQKSLLETEFSWRYRELYERHWWFRAREEMILDLLRRRQPRAGWKTILDIGCGDALFFPELERFGDVDGVEPVASIVSPDNPYRQRIFIGPFDERFQPRKRYSLILMLDVLEHMDEPLQALRHALELLDPGGALVITVPAFQLLWTKHDELNHHRTRYSRASFRRLARKAGMNIQMARYAFHWLVPVKLAVRLKEGLHTSPPSIPEVPPEALNRVFYWLSHMEEKLLGRVGVPAGSSLVIFGGAEAGDDATSRGKRTETCATGERRETEMTANAPGPPRTAP